jgi:hypothetical protein
VFEARAAQVRSLNDRLGRPENSYSKYLTANLCVELCRYLQLFPQRSFGEIDNLKKNIALLIWLLLAPQMLLLVTQRHVFSAPRKVSIPRD